MPKKKKPIIANKAKQQPALYYKGKKLNKFFVEAVKEVGRIKKAKINTPLQIKKFYELNKDKFSKLFDIGLETQYKGTSTVFGQFDKAENNNHEFFIEQSGKQKQTTAKNAKFQLAKLEQHLNTVFGSTGVEYSYKKKFDNSTIITIPDEEELEALEDEPTEVINDYLSEYGIKIYTSDGRKKRKYAKNKPRRKQYSERIETRLKQFRKDVRKEKAESNRKSNRRKKSSKTKTKRKKR